MYCCVPLTKESPVRCAVEIMNHDPKVHGVEKKVSPGPTGPPPVSPFPQFNQTRKKFRRGVHRIQKVAQVLGALPSIRG
ncbi:Hypothetical protein SMAX5B_019112 [Scophthalmus maximus]|uniref:Uncharacterized protein n=1 Tax=Scophthalmus maximus TaxID=52904 RepID=A0A2U9C9U3_SCOMX|nr:Hypothetical protein SMAX5B_019112 [Scophthalmus maximus]